MPTILPENHLPTWEERTGGIRFKDEMDREVRFQFSRFHGVMVTVQESLSGCAYLGDPSELIDWLTAQQARS